MSSHSSHHQHTSTHLYHTKHQQSTSTLASSMGEMKKMFLGRWRSAFRKEAMEVLPEQDSPLSSFLRTVSPAPPLPPAIPPIQHEAFLQQPIWQGTSSDLDWGTQALEDLPHPSHLAVTVLGMEGYQMPPLDPRTSLSAPPVSSTSFGITSTSLTLPSSHDEAIPTKTRHQIPGTLLTPIEVRPPIPTTPSYVGTSPYKSLSNLPPHQEQQESYHQSSSHKELLRQPALLFPKGGESQEVPWLMKTGSVSTTGTGGGQSESGQRSMRD